MYMTFESPRKYSLLCDQHDTKWLRQHGNHHPNTTVRWSNGTSVLPPETDTLALMHKCWLLADLATELLLYGSQAFVVTNAGPVAGFAGFAVSAICDAAWWWARSAQTDGSKVVTGNTRKNVFRRHTGEPHIYFQQQFTAESDTPANSDPRDTEYASNAVLRDMADYDLQGTCYDGMVAILNSGQNKDRDCTINNTIATYYYCYLTSSHTVASSFQPTDFIIAQLKSSNIYTTS